MGERMRTVLLGIALSAFASTASAQEIGGRYEVQGTNLNGSTYAGVAEITVTSENTCRIVWDTGSISSGICMRDDSTFVAGYVLGDKVGLVIYEMQADGSMRGVWTVADTTGVGTENLIPMR